MREENKDQRKKISLLLFLSLFESIKFSAFSETSSYFDALVLSSILGVSAFTAFQKIEFLEGLFDSIKSTHRGNGFVHLFSVLHILKGRKFFTCKSYFFCLNFTINSISHIVNTSANICWRILCRHYLCDSCCTLCIQSFCHAFGRSTRTADVQFNLCTFITRGNFI